MILLSFGNAGRFTRELGYQTPNMRCTYERCLSAMSTDGGSPLLNGCLYWNGFAARQQMGLLSQRFFAKLQ